MFVDSSVIVAILSDEDDAAEWAGRVEHSGSLTSALVIVESTMRLSTKLNVDPALVAVRIQRFLDDAEIALAPMNAQTASFTIAGFARYGKGRGHPAQLNMADCLSYGCAKAEGVALLYKGNDFSYTDLA